MLTMTTVIINMAIEPTTINMEAWIKVRKNASIQPAIEPKNPSEIVLRQPAYSLMIPKPILVIELKNVAAMKA